MSFLARVPALWGGDDTKVWHAMRFFVAPATLWLAPSYGYGVERIPETGGLLLAANHFSGIDHPLIGVFVPRPVYFMAKAELFEIPVFGELLDWTGTFPVRRGEVDRDALRTARTVMREGRILALHVEGTRQRLGYPGPLQLGGLSLAILDDVPVVPCAVDTFRWSPTNRKRCAVVFGEPISLAGVGRGRGGSERAGEIVGAEIVRLWRLAIGAVHDGFPPVLPDGALRAGPTPPGWRPTRDPAAVV